MQVYNKSLEELDRVQAVDFILNRCKYCEYQGKCNNELLEDCNTKVEYLKNKYIYSVQ